MCDEGDAARAMELLGVSRTTWYRKVKELGLKALENTERGGEE
jgi:transcriptional regulator of acetoin/glycerol metabolism